MACAKPDSHKTRQPTNRQVEKISIVYYHYIAEFKDEEQQSQYKQCDPLEAYDNAIHTVFDVSVGKPRGSYKHSQPSPDLH